MGFLNPVALLALPLAALPLVLALHRRRSGDPLRFSSLYLIERARRAARRSPSRSRWVVLLRCAVVALLVLAAARPVGPGSGSAALHHPTRAIVAVDVSRSAGQRLAGGPAWAAIAAGADSVLAAASPDDRIALAAVADGLAGWWEAAPEALRRRLASLGPTDRASDWPVVLEALAGREEAGSETYLVTDGSIGARGPEGGPPAGRRYEFVPSGEPGYRAVLVVGAAGEPNRALAGARRTADGRVALVARAWGPGAPEVVEAGRRVGRTLADPATIPADGGNGGVTWAVGDTGTFALAGGDALPADDVWRVAGGLGGGAYRIGRWAPADEPPDPGGLFWEAALAASDRGPAVERHASLEALARDAPELALLPIRGYRPDQAALLADLAAAGTRLLFVPSCPEEACAPSPGWMPAGGPDLPELRYRMAAPDRRSALSARPTGPGPPGSGLPEPLLDRTPVRGSLLPIGGPAPSWRWDLRSGEPAFWADERAALWLVPLGAPVTRLAETPLFPLVAEAVLAAWDRRWLAGAGGVTAGRPIPVPPGGATVTGPVGDPVPSTWRVGPGEAPPRPERAGIYRVDAEDVRAGSAGANFVAVNGDPAEGDLTPIPDSDWSDWGRVVTSVERWRAARFPRRRGSDLWPWLLALALVGLVAEARLSRDRVET